MVETDQSPAGGGEGSAPSPFALFLSSIGTCAGIYALGFCQSRGIDASDMSIDMDLEHDPASGMIRKVTLKLNTPEGFPAKYEAGIIRSMNLCAVKKHLENPPEFVTVTDLSDKA